MANQESDAYVSKHHRAVKALKATIYIFQSDPVFSIPNMWCRWIDAHATEISTWNWRHCWMQLLLSVSWLAIIDMVWCNDHPQVIITNAHQRNCILIRGTGVWCYVKNRTILVHNLSTWKICGWELRWPVCNLFSLSFSFVGEDSLDINYTWTNLRWVHLKQVSI